MTRQIEVPALLLAVFKVEFLALGVGSEQVELVLGVERLQRVGALHVERLGVGKTQRIALVGIVAHGAETIFEVGTTSHDVPHVGMGRLAAALFIVGVVVVGESEHVAELVAHRADAVEILVCVGRLLQVAELHAAGIATEAHAIELQAVGTRGPRQVGSMGPDVVAVVALHVAAVAGKDEVDHVDGTVAIEVVVLVVHLVVGGTQCGHDEAVNIVVALGICGIIIYLEGAYDVEGGIEDSE